jgi:hypothetical protein
MRFRLLPLGRDRVKGATSESSESLLLLLDDRPRGAVWLIGHGSTVLCGDCGWEEDGDDVPGGGSKLSKTSNDGGEKGECGDCEF